MKKNKLLTCMTAVFVLMLLISCSNKNDSRITMSDICVFRQRSDGIPIKTAITSGITSTVCVDPLCLHNAECPLYDSVNMGEYGAIPIGDIYCFVRGNMSEQKNTGIHSGEVRLCAYNMTNGELRILETYHDSILLMYGYDHYLYYTVSVYSKTDEGVKNSYALYRADIDSGKIIEIPLESEYSTVSYMNTADFPSIYTVDDDMIYWYAPGEDGYVQYTTDLVGKNRRDLPITNPRIMNGEYYGGWAYYTLNKHNGTYADCETDIQRLQFLNERILRRYNMETGQDELIAENLADYIVTENGIFYTVFESEPHKINNSGDTHYDIFAGKIYHMNHNGSEAKLLCVLDGIDLNVYTELFLGYADGKLALAYMDEVENSFFDSGYDYNISPDVIIVDTADGSWKVSEDET